MSICGVKLKSLITILLAAVGIAMLVLTMVLPAVAQEYDIFDQVRPSAMEKMQSGDSSSLTPLERMSLGREGCEAYGPSLSDCSPAQLEADRQFYNSMSDEEWNALPQDIRDYFGSLRSSDGSSDAGSSDLLYDSAYDAWYVYYPSTGERYWY